jgi:hypothetical protein
MATTTPKHTRTHTHTHIPRIPPPTAHIIGTDRYILEHSRKRVPNRSQPPVFFPGNYHAKSLCHSKIIKNQFSITSQQHFLLISPPNCISLPPMATSYKHPVYIHYEPNELTDADREIVADYFKTTMQACVLAVESIPITGKIFLHGGGMSSKKPIQVATDLHLALGYQRDWLLTSCQDLPPRLGATQRWLALLVGGCCRNCHEGQAKTTIAVCFW